MSESPSSKYTPERYALLEKMAKGMRKLRENPEAWAKFNAEVDKKRAKFHEQMREVARSRRRVLTPEEILENNLATYGCFPQLRPDEY
jgi:hypothetical protein